MISHVYATTIYVRDQDRALDFYTSKLGFGKRRDDPMGPDARWIEVIPPGAQSAVLLYKPTPEMPGASTYEKAMEYIGTFSPILFACSDVQKTYEELKAKGVNFTTPAEQQPWGWWAVFEDQDGNSFGLTQV
jgi:predicted enzyme related to lactoylglutathione lyase